MCPRCAAATVAVRCRQIDPKVSRLGEARLQPSPVSDVGGAVAGGGVGGSAGGGRSEARPHHQRPVRASVPHREDLLVERDLQGGVPDPVPLQVSPVELLPQSRALLQRLLHHDGHGLHLDPAREELETVKEVLRPTINDDNLHHFIGLLHQGNNCFSFLTY